MLINEKIAEIGKREDLDARQKGDLLEALIFSLTKEDLLAYENMEAASEYIDAEERALAADGEVLDAEDFDPEVDEVDASEAVEAWEDGDGQFKFVLGAE